MSNEPKVSVVTIAFRDLPGLKKTVESVRSQRYPHVEHVIIDGGSGPEVVEYLTASDPAFAYWQSQPDDGRYDAMNQGIKHATGQLVWFMHAGDCFSDPDAIGSVVDALADKGPIESLWGYGNANRVDADGQVLNVWNSIPFDLHRFSTARQVLPHQASFFGSELTRAVGGYDLSFDIAADQLFMWRAALLHPPVTVDRIVCDFDTTGAGTTREMSKNYADLRRAYDLLNHYPHGSRWKSFAFTRYHEYLTRSKMFVLGRLVRLKRMSTQ